LKPKVIRDMVLISKYDKKIWEDYISNYENFVIVSKKRCTLNTKDKKIKSSLYKDNKYKNSSKTLKKRGLKPEGVLDLHGQTLYSGKIILRKYLINCYEKNIRDVLIITGKGQNKKGVLKEEVPKWLDDNILKKFIINYEIAPKHFGGDGALLVRIKNKYKNNN
tara:strand:- start:124 stop:615 length:492 start_codon:yes stop_codon:yes gene_type:complete